MTEPESFGTQPRARAEIMRDIVDLNPRDNVLTFIGLIDEVGERIFRDNRVPTAAELDGLYGAVFAVRASQMSLAKIALADSLAPGKSASDFAARSITRQDIVAELVKLRCQHGV